MFSPRFICGTFYITAHLLGLDYRYLVGKQVNNVAPEYADMEIDIDALKKSIDS